MMLILTSCKRIPSLCRVSSVVMATKLVENRDVLSMSTTSSSLTDGIAVDQQEALMNEICITVNQDDLAIGSRTKRDCHLMDNIEKGLLHRAFSVLLFNERNEFLLTRRAATKVTFPNYYTNACCSHPLFTPLEREEKDGLGVRRAAQRKLYQELGIDPNTITIDDIKYITRILYKSPSNSLWGEHELDYILIIHKDVQIKPNPDEVSDVVFLNKEELVPFMAQKERDGFPISPWFKLIHDKFLYDYWNNLTKLDKMVDHKTIHQFT